MVINIEKYDNGDPTFLYQRERNALNRKSYIEENARA